MLCLFVFIYLDAIIKTPVNKVPVKAATASSDSSSEDSSDSSESEQERKVPAKVSVVFHLLLWSPIPLRRPENVEAVQQCFFF